MVWCGVVVVLRCFAFARTTPFSQFSNATSPPPTTHGTGVEAKIAIVESIKEGIEIVSNEYTNFLSCYVPAFEHVLKQVAPQTEKTQEHKLRNTVMEIIHRLPHNELLKSHVDSLMVVCLRVLGGDEASGILGDNEENALLALKVVLDLHKNFRPHLERFIQPLVSFITKSYQGFNESAQALFAGNKRPLALGSASFLVIAECPMLLMFLIQVYPRTQASIGQALVPMMTAAMAVREPEHLLHKSTLNELKAAQVKTTTFLVYLLRLSMDAVNSHSVDICTGIVNLLTTCSDHAANRKELLVAC